MTIPKRIMCGLLLGTTLQWLPSANGADFSPRECKREIDNTYFALELKFDIRGYETDWLTQMDKLVADFKRKCGPLEALSVADLENGNYLRKLRANAERIEKARFHLYEYGQGLPEPHPSQQIFIPR